MNIYITGHSSISAIGQSHTEVYQRLIAKETGIRQEAKDQGAFRGLVKQSNKSLSKLYNLKKPYSRTTILGIAAGIELFKKYSIEPTSILKTGFVSGTSVGGIDFTEQEYIRFLSGNTYNPEVFKNHPSGAVTDQIAQKLYPFDIVNTISTACSSSTNAIIFGAKLMQMGLVDRVVVGGTDALSDFTIKGFSSLGIYSEGVCKPFDRNRQGLNLGEGAAYLLLENKKSLNLSENKILAELTGWANESDAFHQTASSPEGEGAQRSMMGAITMAGLQPKDISYISAHGTATPNNDLSESNALLKVFGIVPPFSSTKSYTGHTLAASGALEASFCLIGMEKNCLFPNLFFENVIEETGLTPVTNPVKEKKINHILSNAFGFGGNNTSIILSQV